MKILITGATGFVGSHIADQLIEKGHEVRCIARKTSNLRWLENKPLEIVEASLGDIHSLEKAVAGVDYIYHIAGLTFAKNYEEFLKGNRDGTRNIIEATLEVNPNIKRFVFMSSQTVAGPSESLEKPVTEELLPQPITSYGKSKKAAEDEVLKHKDKLPVTIVRAPAVYGPRDTAIHGIFQAAKYGFGVLIGFKPKYVSLIHSEDLARGTIMAAESEKAISQIYFISSDEFYTWDQIGKIIKNHMNKKFYIGLKLPHFLVLTVAGISEFLGKFSSKPPVFNYEKGIDFIQSYWTCSTEKARNDLGYQQLISIDYGIKQTIQWYKKHGWL